MADSTCLLRADSQPASLYWNQGDYFVDIARKAGIATLTKAPVKWVTGFADFDNDGWLDIIVANGNFSSLLDTLPKEGKFAQPIQLFRNRGDLTFEEVANEAGLNAGRLYSRRGTTFGDINNDGKLDVVIFDVGTHMQTGAASERNGRGVRLCGKHSSSFF